MRVLAFYEIAYNMIKTIKLITILSLTIVFSLLITISLILMFGGSRVYPPPVERITSNRLFFTFNEYRLIHRLAPLSYDPKLCPFAEIRLTETKTNWTHAGFFKHFRDYLTTKINFFGENLARNFHTSEETLTAWDNSPSHRENLVQPSFNAVCFATDGNYTVQELEGTKKE